MLCETYWGRHCVLFSFIVRHPGSLEELMKCLMNGWINEWTQSIMSWFQLYARHSGCCVNLEICRACIDAIPCNSSTWVGLIGISWRPYFKSVSFLFCLSSGLQAFEFFRRKVLYGLYEIATDDFHDCDVLIRLENISNNFALIIWGWVLFLNPPFPREVLLMMKV